MNDGEKLYEVERALDGKKQVRFCKDCAYFKKRANSRCAVSVDYLKKEFSSEYLSTADSIYLATCKEMRSREDFCGSEGKLFVLKEPKLSWFKKLFK